MDKQTKVFRKSLESLKGTEAVFREYSHIALVEVLDVTTSNEEFSITFKSVNAKSKEEPITIGSIWSNASIFANGFSIGYVGSQMIIGKVAVTNYKEMSKEERIARNKIDIFRNILDGVSNEPTDYGPLNRFKISTMIYMRMGTEPAKTSWSFHWNSKDWVTTRTDFYEGFDGKSRKKRNILVSPKSVDVFIRAIQSMTIPLTLSFPTGCDGGVIEFEYGDTESGMKLRWWSDPPKELELLDESIKNLLEELTDA